MAGSLNGEGEERTPDTTLEYLVLMSSYLDFLIQLQQSHCQVPYWRLCWGSGFSNETLLEEEDEEDEDHGEGNSITA